MRYFVTGGAGFIGSALVTELLQDKNQVTVYDDLSSGRYDYIKELKPNPDFKFIRGDVLNFKALNQAMKGQEFVFHLAANSDIKLGRKDTKRDFKINTIGTINVLDSMVKNKIKKIAFASTSTVFGMPTKIPTPEDYGPSLPQSFYGASKLACEGFISTYANIFRLKAWIFRFANITGKPATHGIIFDFVKKIKKNPARLEVLGDGNQEKSYITNQMLIEAMFHVIKKTEKIKDKIFLYNIGNDDKIKVKEIAKMFVKINRLKTKLVYSGGKVGWEGDVPLMLLSNNKVKKLGWTPKKTSRECILEAIRNNPLE